jgi:hypothetical protein
MEALAALAVWFLVTIGVGDIFFWAVAQSANGLSGDGATDRWRLRATNKNA